MAAAPAGAIATSARGRRDPATSTNPSKSVTTAHRSSTFRVPRVTEAPGRPHRTRQVAASPQLVSGVSREADVPLHGLRHSLGAFTRLGRRGSRLRHVVPLVARMTIDFRGRHVLPGASVAAVPRSIANGRREAARRPNRSRDGARRHRHREHARAAHTLTAARSRHRSRERHRPDVAPDAPVVVEAAVGRIGERARDLDHRRAGRGHAHTVGCTVAVDASRSSTARRITCTANGDGLGRRRRRSCRRRSARSRRPSSVSCVGVPVGGADRSASGSRSCSGSITTSRRRGARRGAAAISTSPSRSRCSVAGTGSATTSCTSGRRSYWPAQRAGRPSRGTSRGWNAGDGMWGDGQGSCTSRSATRACRSPNLATHLMTVTDERPRRRDLPDQRRQGRPTRRWAACTSCSTARASCA